MLNRLTSMILTGSTTALIAAWTDGTYDVVTDTVLIPCWHGMAVARQGNLVVRRDDGKFDILTPLSEAARRWDFAARTAPAPTSTNRTSRPVLANA